MALHTTKAAEDLRPLLLAPMYARPGEALRAPRHKLPDLEMAPDTVYQFVHDELMLDGNSRLNLATFVTTWMEPQANQLMADTFDKNMIDKDEYPRTAELEMRCVNMLSSSVELTRRGRGRRDLDDGFQRGRDARGHGVEVALARPRSAPRASPPTPRTW